MNFDKEMLAYAVTDRQREHCDAYLKHGSERKAAKALGVNAATVHSALDRVRKRAIRQGYEPKFGLLHPAPEGRLVGKITHQYDAEGNIERQWVRTHVDADRQIELFREAIDELKQTIKPVEPVALANKTQLDHLLNLYILTDAHLGMRSWAEETGANWDIKIAEETILKAMGHLVATSPNAKTGFFLQLGDFLHYDGILPVTPNSGHVLDSDSRAHLIVRTAIRIYRQCVAMLLRKHEQVVVLMAAGNHDQGSAVWLQEWPAVIYEEEPRVNVLVSPNPYYAYVHHKVLLGAHHGHKRTKLADLGSKFNEQFRHLLGDTKRTYIHTGHLHQDEKYSNGTTKIERHETIAAPDAYAAHGGWVSDRSMKCITYNHLAEIGRATIMPEMLLPT